MPAPFYNAIKGTTAGTPGTGAYTPSGTPVTGFRAWTTVPAGWVGMVRFEDGAAWELSFCYWNGTTLSRAATQLFDSSSGSILTLTSAATAALIGEANEFMSHLGGIPWRVTVPAINSASLNNVGMPALTATGTAAGQTVANTNFLAMQPRIRYPSATTANAQAGLSTVASMWVYSTTAGLGGGELVCRFGASQIPTGPRLFVGMTSSTWVGSTGEPSALVSSAIDFYKDRTDTNIQFYTNDASGGGSKNADTGIALVANGWYEASVWFEPGGGRAYGLLIRVDTGAIWYGSTTTQLPVHNTTLLMNVNGGLSATTGTAINFDIGQICSRNGG
jgi:hypothetical protein